MGEFDPENPGDLARLRTSMVWSNRRLRDFRSTMVYCLRQYAGRHYGEGAATDNVPINLLELGVNIYQREVASGDPQVLCRPLYKELTPGAADLEIVTNYQIKEMDLTASLNSAAISAMFLWGVIKVGVTTKGQPSNEEGYLHDPGMVFADHVLPEDFFLDMMAKRFEQCGYMGNHFRVPLEWAINNPDYDPKARKSLTSQTPLMYDTDRGGNLIRAETLSQGQGPLYDEYRDRAELIEIWLPEEGLILTMAGNSDTKPLKIVKWDGPAHGPFHILGFEEVPGNLIPSPPVIQWLDIHQAANKLLNKNIRQAERSKKIVGVQGHAKEDGNRVLSASDGDMILMENPEGVKEFITGGPDQVTMGMVIWLRDLVSYLGGNWEVLGGLAPQTKTVGQDRLLNQNASGRVADMQKKMLKFTQGIVTDIAWHVWHDPMVHIPFQKPIQGTDITIPSVFRPEKRKGEFFDYTFSIDPYSMQSLTPGDRAQALQQFLTQMYPLLAPAMQQAGVSIDWEKTFKLLSTYTRIPELMDILVFQNGQSQPSPQMPPDQQQQPAAQMSPPSTTRNYVRENVPQGASQGRSQALSQMLMGGKAPQAAEMASFGRQ